MQLSTTGAFAVQEMAGVTLKEYDEVGLAFEDLVAGRIDAVASLHDMLYRADTEALEQIYRSRFRFLRTVWQWHIDCLVIPLERRLRSPRPFIRKVALPGRSRGHLGATNPNMLKPTGLPLHLQTGVWSFVRLNKNPLPFRRPERQGTKV